MKKQLYLDLADRLKAQVPELRWIDLDHGQLQLFEYRPEVAFPCALIDYQTGSYTDQGQLAQLGELVLTVTLATASFSATHQPAPMNVKDKGLAFFDLEEKVVQAVHGWVPTDAGGNEYAQALVRVGDLTNKSFEELGLRVRVISFSVGIEDYSTQRPYGQAAKPTPILNLIN